MIDRPKLIKSVFRGGIFMDLFLTVLVSSAVQIIVIGIIPFIWWFAAARKEETFFSWIGLKKFKEIKKVGIKTIIASVLFLLLSLYLLFVTKDMETATSQFSGLGVPGLAGAIVYSFIQTSFTEELFFRGFLLKRIGHKFGFYAGNIIQSILFALLHCVMFIALAKVSHVVLITLFTGIIAFVMGWINEKEAEGSILPSWCIHGVSNLVSSIFSLFSVF